MAGFSKKQSGDMAGATSHDDVKVVNGTAFPPDSLINHTAAIAYWSSTPASMVGVLGGHPQVNKADLQGSADFLARLRRRSKHYAPDAGKLKRVADCGAGIGRITMGFLKDVAEVIDIVEPVQAFTNKVKDNPCVGKIYNVGLEQWQPETTYDVIWHQWCMCQVTDKQLVAYLRQLAKFLHEGGWIIIKENISTDPNGEDIFDETDNTVTRTDNKFRGLFEMSGLQIVSTELQRGFPKSLCPVRCYALQPK